jgi:REP element-mobilizing transposase RayT
MEGRTRKHLSHFIPHWLRARPFYFITINCAVRGQNQLCHETVGQALLTSARYYHDRCRWHALIVLLMPDHLHGILSFPTTPGMRQTVSAWKGYHRRALGIGWQSGFFDHRLRNRRSLEEKLSYILNNPVRKGLCASAQDWPYILRPQDRGIC